MLFVERVNIFGDLSGINASDIRTFVDTTNHSYGGSYPNREEDLSDEEVTRRTHELLTEGGVLDPFPITLCSTAQERVIQILRDCNLRRMQNRVGLYWIIDRDPQSFLESARSVKDTVDLQTATLSSITVVQVGSEQIFDRLDAVTGIRVISFPPALYRFPTHPTPAS